MQHQIEEIFKRYDGNSDGEMSIEEMRNLLVSVSRPAPQPRHGERAHALLPLCQVGGLFGFGSSLQDVSSLHALLDVDNSKSVSWQARLERRRAPDGARSDEPLALWQEWSHACAVWLLEMGH